MNKNWFVADKNGNLAGHDMNEYSAKALESTLQESEPENEWEAMEDEK